MGKLLQVVVAAALFIALGTQVSSAQGPTQDSVTGKALVTPFDALVTIDAHSDPSGNNPGGTFSANICPQLLSGGGCTTRNPELGGTVTCLNVRGNQAIMGYYSSRRETLFEFVRFVGFAEVVDNGSPGILKDRVSWTRQVVPVDTPPYTTCPATLPEGPEFSGILPPPPSPSDPKYGGLSNTAQDFVVTDGPAVPASPTDCKNGGWRAYRVFKNQSDCVGFVASNGRHRPAATSP